MRVAECQGIVLACFDGASVRRSGGLLACDQLLAPVRDVRDA